MDREICLEDQGFTLIELIMVIVIIGILSSTAVPKFINLTESANEAKCAANRGAIASAVTMVYAAIVASDPTQAEWFSTVTYAELSDTMFATGGVPECPTSGSYALNSGNVVCSLHGT